MAAESIGAAHPLDVALDDGSHSQLASAAQLQVLENSAHALVLQVRRGKSALDVRPGGPRRWLIECGPASVEVVGPRFDVVRDERGVAMVRAVTLPNGVVRLRAGQRAWWFANSRSRHPRPAALSGDGARVVAADSIAEREPGRHTRGERRRVRPCRKSTR